MAKLTNKLKCFFGKHIHIKWSNEECAKANVFDGIFAPWKCKHCDATGQGFPIPDMPMPAVKPPREP